MSQDAPIDVTTATFPDTRHVLEAGCDRCALAADRECLSWGTGSLEADLVVVGEAPASGNPDATRWRGGNWTGIAYTSRHAGRRIRAMIESLGREAYYTNAIKCFPADPDDPSTNREPTDGERRTCRAHLLAEREAIRPTVVLATGKHATTSVLAADDRSLEGFLETVLEPIRCEGLGLWLLPVLHPSYQDVWLRRLGYDPASYVAAIDDRLSTLLE